MIESNAIEKNFIVCLCDNLIVGSVILNCLATHPSLRIWSLMLEQLRYSRALCLSRGTVMAESCHLIFQLIYRRADPFQNSALQPLPPKLRIKPWRTD